MPSQHAIIEHTKAFVQRNLMQAEGGHDWFHTLRVYQNAIAIAKHEQVNMFIVKLAALLHDIADSKFYNGDETIAPKLAENFLTAQHVDQAIIAHVIAIIRHLSFKNETEIKVFNSIELQVVQDADRLDAIGAIGIARCFNYGGFKNRAIYNPNIVPNLNMTKAEYKASDAPSINHFYEKLLLLKDLMNTQTAKQIATQRHAFMELYLTQFYNEVNGNEL